MEPWIVLGLGLLFAGTHIGLATRRVRAGLVSRLGDNGYITAFSLVATLTFAAFIVYFATHHAAGPPGLGLASVPAVGPVLIGVICIGFVLIGASVPAYDSQPAALFLREVDPPRGITRVSRHAMFAGTALFAGAHVLLADRLTGTLGFAVLLLVAVLGARHQDTKLIDRYGEPYRDYMRATSIVPFAAILSGRQRLSVGELPFVAMLGGLLVAVLLRTVHSYVFAHAGIWVIASVLALGSFASARAERRARRSAAGGGSKPAGTAGAGQRSSPQAARVPGA